MAFRFSLVSSAVLSLLLIFFLSNNYHQPALAAPPPQHFILAIQWAYTVCTNRPDCLSTFFRTEFTVHGLWSHPEADPCVGPYPFIYEVLLQNQNPTLLYRMKWNWVDAESTNNAWLWRHEYNTHGICTKFGRKKADTITYFQKGMDAYATIPPLGNVILPLFKHQPAVDEATVYNTLRPWFQNKDYTMICNNNGQLQELRIFFKYQDGGVNLGWTFEDIPPEDMKRCSGSITLPIS